MKSATKLAVFAFVLTVNGLGCGQHDNVVGSQPGRDGLAGSSGDGGSGVRTVSGSAGAGSVASLGGLGGGVAGTVKAGAANGGSSSYVGNGGMPASVNDQYGGHAGATGGVGSGGYLDSGGNGNALQIGGGGLALSPTNGWLDGTSNEFAIQGALFADADSTSMQSLTANFTGARACIRGTAVKVDMASTPCKTLMFTPPALDCYGEFWGAEVGLNLNQRVMGGPPLPFDARALAGFAFEISGDNVPGPTAFRFQVEGPAGKFCNSPAIKIKVGGNAVLFSDLAVNCWNTSEATPMTDAAKSALVRIEWWMVTNPTASMPYDFCVSNIRAIPK